ncbi:hypothetical protein ACO0LO_01785 [Undibacterium sp. TJN25]|uniref:hypothetical protein n=1 Tax=Undibacterium sp. TJN25 TaxID=3413056 RepID=UPI003BEFCAE4
MMIKSQTVRAAAVQDFKKCPHWGKGGQYLVDPASGARVLQEQAETVTPASATTAAAVASSTTRKDKTRE